MSFGGRGVLLEKRHAQMRPEHSIGSVGFPPKA